MARAAAIIRSYSSSSAPSHSCQPSLIRVPALALELRSSVAAAMLKPSPSYLHQPLGPGGKPLQASALSVPHHFVVPAVRRLPYAPTITVVVAAAALTAAIVMIRNSVTRHAWLTCTSLPSLPSSLPSLPSSPPSRPPPPPPLSPSSPSLSPALPSRRVHSRHTINTHALGYRLPTRPRLHLVRSTSPLLHLHTVPAFCDCQYHGYATCMIALPLPSIQSPLHVCSPPPAMRDARSPPFRIMARRACIASQCLMLHGSRRGFTL